MIQERKNGNSNTNLYKLTTKFSFNRDSLFIYFYLNRIYQDLQANSFIGLTLKRTCSTPNSS